MRCSSGAPDWSWTCRRVARLESSCHVWATGPLGNRQGARSAKGRQRRILFWEAVDVGLPFHADTFTRAWEAAISPQNETAEAPWGRFGRSCLTKRSYFFSSAGLASPPAGASAAGASAAGASAGGASAGGVASAGASGAAASGAASLPPPHATARAATGTSAINLEIDMLGSLLPGARGPSDAFQTPRYSESAQNPRKSRKHF
jgi:hypothetical protein